MSSVASDRKGLGAERGGGGTEEDWSRLFVVKVRHHSNRGNQTFCGVFNPPDQPGDYYHVLLQENSLLAT